MREFVCVQVMTLDNHPSIFDTQTHHSFAQARCTRLAKIYAYMIHSRLAPLFTTQPRQGSQVNSPHTCHGRMGQSSVSRVKPMDTSKKQFIADLWFVGALLTPLFVPVLILCLAPDASSFLGAVLHAMLMGPLCIWQSEFALLGSFALLCALPTLFVAIHALVLRVMVSSALPQKHWMFIPSMLLMAGVHAAGGYGAWMLLHDPSQKSLAHVGLYCGGWFMYVVVVTLWMTRRSSRAYGFEMLLGLMLMEHLLVPVIGQSIHYML